MTLLQQLLGRSGPGPQANLSNPAVPISSGAIVELFRPGGSSYSGRPVSPEVALTSSAVWQAVNLISDTCGGLPLHAYRKTGGSRAALTAPQPAAVLLDNPHPDMTPLQLWGLGFGSMCLYGNAYYLKLRNQLGVITELWWINPSRVKAYRLDEGPDAGQKRYILDGNEEQPHSDKTILHVPGFGYDGTTGVSPIRAARHAIGLGLDAEQFGGMLYANGALASGILQTDQRIEQDEAVRLKAMWKAQGTGLDSAHDVRIIGSGASYQQLTINPEDAQFLETREFQITDIARWFGIPPHMLMQTDKATSWGTGIETQNIAMITYTFSRYTSRFEQGLTKHVLSPAAVYAKFSYSGLLRGDSKSRSAFYREMWGIGAFSTNDIRAYEDLDDVEGGDVRYVPMNMMELGKEPAPVVQPAAPAPPAEETEPEPEPAEETESESETADA